MTVYQIETRDKDYKSIIITASYERTRKELDTEERKKCRCYSDTLHNIRRF